MCGLSWSCAVGERKAAPSDITSFLHGQTYPVQKKCICICYLQGNDLPFVTLPSQQFEEIQLIVPLQDSGTSFCCICSPGPRVDLVESEYWWFCAKGAEPPMPDVQKLQVETLAASPGGSGKDLLQPRWTKVWAG